MRTTTASRRYSRVPRPVAMCRSGGQPTVAHPNGAVRRSASGGAPHPGQSSGSCPAVLGAPLDDRIFSHCETNTKTPDKRTNR